MKSLMLCLAALAVALEWSSHALAKPKLLEKANNDYWIGHGVGTGLLAIGAATTSLIPSDARDVKNPTALGISNAALTLELIAPVPALAATTSKLEFANFGLVYGQTVLASVMFNNLSKTLPKPLRLNGNSLLAFAAAYSASASLDRQQPVLTRSRREVEMVARDVFWAFELGLASVTGASDVASGRGDVYSYFAGAVLGTGLGIGIQAAHEENVLRGPSPNWAYPLIGFALASGFGVVLPACLRSDTTVALNRTVVEHRLQLVPFSDATGASGLALSGLF